MSRSVEVISRSLPQLRRRGLIDLTAVPHHDAIHRRRLLAGQQPIPYVAGHGLRRARERVAPAAATAGDDPDEVAPPQREARRAGQAGAAAAAAHLDAVDAARPTAVDAPGRCRRAAEAAIKDRLVGLD